MSPTASFRISTVARRTHTAGQGPMGSPYPAACTSPMRSTDHRREPSPFRHRSMWQHDWHTSPQEDRPELRNLSRLSKLGGPSHLTFSDALGAVRRQLWEDGLFQASGQSRDMVKIPAPLAQRLLDAACFPA